MRRKEIFAIILFTLLIFTLVSLLSFSNSDPSLHHAREKAIINNLFGLPGAYLSGMLIGLFGIGAFWIPILLLLSSIHLFCNHHLRIILKTIIGSIILIITTGSLFTLIRSHYFFFGNPISSGGIIGIQFKLFLEEYLSFTISAAGLVLIWIIGFILISGFPLIAFAIFCRKFIKWAAHRTNTFFIIRKEQRRRAKKRLKGLGRSED